MSLRNIVDAIPCICDHESHSPLEGRLSPCSEVLLSCESLPDLVGLDVPEADCKGEEKRAPPCVGFGADVMLRLPLAGVLSLSPYEINRVFLGRSVAVLLFALEYRLWLEMLLMVSPVAYTCAVRLQTFGDYYQNFTWCVLEADVPELGMRVSDRFGERSVENVSSDICGRLVTGRARIQSRVVEVKHDTPSEDDACGFRPHYFPILFHPYPHTGKEERRGSFNIMILEIYKIIETS